MSLIEGVEEERVFDEASERPLLKPEAIMVVERTGRGGKARVAPDASLARV